MNFPESVIRIQRFRPGELSEVARIPLSTVKDCYNLMIHTAPLMLTRHSDNMFEIVWPERTAFSAGVRESFNFRTGDNLYFNEWFEDPDYREETVVRAIDGTELERHSGDIHIMPNGEKWLIR